MCVDTDPSTHARTKLEDFTVNLAHWTVTPVNPKQPPGLMFQEIHWHCCYPAKRAEETLPAAKAAGHIPPWAVIRRKICPNLWKDPVKGVSSLSPSARWGQSELPQRLSAVLAWSPEAALRWRPGPAPSSSLWFCITSLEEARRVCGVTGV